MRTIAHREPSRTASGSVSRASPGDAETAPLLTLAERQAAGADLRGAVPRHRHAEWMSPAHRADPVAILIEQGRQRIPELLPIRYDRMRASPLAFLRGAAAVMAADLAETPVSGLRVQACGDCHLANFGSYATPEGLPVFDINDFDETLPAPFEWDVKRLATSLVLAGREDGMAEDECRMLAADAAHAYCSELSALAELPPLVAWSARIDLQQAIGAIGAGKARARAEKRLHARLHSAEGQYGLIDNSGPVPRLREKPPLVVRLSGHDDAVRQAFARYPVTLAPERRSLLQRYRLQDVIFKVVGVGSVGTFCAIGLFTTADGQPLLLQIKQAQASVLVPYAGASDYSNQGERVVTGQRTMQAASDLFLGWTLMPEDGRMFYVRRLKDARLAEIGSQIEAESLPAYAALCGRTLGRAHARSGDAAMLAGYLGRGNRFAEAVAEFGMLYADRTQSDWRLFEDAIATGRIKAAPG